MTRVSIFIVSQPDYDDENIDSIWSSEDAALERASQLGGAFVSEHRLDQPNSWVRNGWAPVGNPPTWSDWGQERP